MTESKAATWGALTDTPPDDFDKYKVNAQIVELQLDEFDDVALDKEYENEIKTQ